MPSESPNLIRVLIVDDSRDSTFLLSKILERLGHEPRITSDGPSALKLLPEFRPRIVLLDVGLPGMSGHEVARRIRQQPGLESLVIVMISGYGQAVDKQRSVEAGADYHLVKPVEIDDLARIIDELPS